VSPKKKPRLVILDGHGIIYRSYFAFPEPLTVRKTGEVVTAVYGFANTLITIIDELRPTHIAVALDPPGPTFRHKMDATYKANRFEGLKGQVLAIIDGVSAPDEAKEALVAAIEPAKNSDEICEKLIERLETLDLSKKVREELRTATEPVERMRDIAVQTRRVRELIEAFNIPIYVVEGFEADDVLGTLAKQGEEAGTETYIVTLDSDMIQLVRDGVKVFMMRPYQRDTVTYDTKLARDRYQIEPEQMADLKGLKGDTSDNVPGVPGIGDKTAVKLLQQFSSVENLYDHLDEVTPEKLREKLREHEDLARHSKEMATIHTGAPVTLDLEACQVERYEREKVVKLFKELEFRSLAARLPESATSAKDRRATEVTVIEGQEYRAVYTEAELDDLVGQLASVNAIAFDTETTAPSAMHSSLVGISLSWAAGQAAYVPVGHRQQLGEQEQLPLDVVLRKLTPLLED
jgi:5'-3' exonuclease